MDVFNKFYKKYDDWYDENKFIFLSELEAVRKVIPEEGKGLEIGVGSGRFASELNIEYGVDPSINMLKLAKARGVVVATGFGEELPFKDNSFDYAAILTTLSFVKNVSKVFYEAKRVVKKSGYIISGIIDEDSFLGELYKEKSTSKFYTHCKFLSSLELLDVYKKSDILITEIYQTLFKAPQLIDKIEKPKISFGEGGYVVVKGLNVK